MRELTDILQLIQPYLAEILAFLLPAVIAAASGLLIPFAFAAAAAHLMSPVDLRLVLALIFFVVACLTPALVAVELQARKLRRDHQPGGAAGSESGAQANHHA